MRIGDEPPALHCSTLSWLRLLNTSVFHFQNFFSTLHMCAEESWPVSSDLFGVHFNGQINRCSFRLHSLADSPLLSRYIICAKVFHVARGHVNDAINQLTGCNQQGKCKKLEQLRRSSARKLKPLYSSVIMTKHILAI